MIIIIQSTTTSLETAKTETQKMGQKTVLFEFKCHHIYFNSRNMFQQHLKCYESIFFVDFIVKHIN